MLSGWEEIDSKEIPSSEYRFFQLLKHYTHSICLFRIGYKFYKYINSVLSFLAGIHENSESIGTFLLDHSLGKVTLVLKALLITLTKLHLYIPLLTEKVNDFFILGSDYSKQ